MYCMSVSHKMAPIQIREKFAFSIEEQQIFLQKVISKKAIQGCVILSTCNRSEIYFTGEKDAMAVMEEALADYKEIPLSEVIKYLMIFEGKRAVIHLYRVASGLDSMVLGEDEILGQVKKAYQTALENKATDSRLNLIFQGAMSSAKKVKHQTMLSKTAISVGTLVAHEIFDFKKDDGSKKKVLIIGITGKMGTIIMKNVLHRKDVEIIGTTRQHGYEMSITSDHMKVIHYSERYQYMDEADIVVSATSSPHYTLTYEAVEEKLRTNKERLFIDLAVPIDIDKRIQGVEKVKLYDIDHFEVLSKQNNELKLKEVEKGNWMIEEEVEELLKKLCFQEILNEMPEIEKYFSEKDFKHILFLIRDIASSKELKMLQGMMQKLMINEEDQYRK